MDEALDRVSQALLLAVLLPILAGCSTRQPAPANVAEVVYSCPLRQAEREDTNILVQFSNSGVWLETASTGWGYVGRCGERGAYMRIGVVAESSDFKYFSEPHVTILIVDADGLPIAFPDIKIISERAMALGGPVRKRSARYIAIPDAEFARAKFVFFKFRHCASHMNFARDFDAQNGCYRPDLHGRPAYRMDPEIRLFEHWLKQNIQALQAPIGVEFEVEGWQGARIR